MTIDRPAISYHPVTKSVEGFIQQVAVSYLANGYFFYVQGWLPEGKDPCTIDSKLIERYGINISKWSRARRKKVGSASLQYIRFGRLFLIMATHGRSNFFEEERASIKDARKTPIKAFGYAISHRAGHSHIRIEMNEYKRLKAHLVGLASHRVSTTLESEFFRVPFEPYAPVRRQLLNIWRAVNRVRKVSGFDLVPIECIRLKRLRTSLKVF